MKARAISLLLCLLVGCAAVGVAAPQPKGRTIRGLVYDLSTREPIPFASIYVVDAGKGCVSDATGHYELTTTARGDISLKVSSLGYATRELTVGRATQRQDIGLQVQSVALENFTVTAKYHDRLGSDATVGQEALEYIQPTSLQDIFQLLPGGKMGSNNLQQRRLVSSRQVGADASTAFGMGISIDGVPMQNDGQRVQLSGFTGIGPTDQEGATRINSGIDLRTISTDHIESVTVSRGIASAKEGNISSGSIRITPKQGQSPLRARVKFDPLNKLAYVGKGLLLSEQLGTLYLGADVVRSASSIDDSRGAYNRFTAQATWSNQQRWWGRKVDWNLRGSYVTSFNNNKTDDIIENYDEDYHTRYQRATLAARLTATLSKPLVDELELMASADYASDRLEHNKQVVNRSVMPLQQSVTEGESDGEFLPQMYRTYYELDNQPLSFFGQLTAQKFGELGRHTSFSALMGASLGSTKNLGQGVVSDPLRPPFPSSEYIRPRANSDIPALVNQAAYAELRLRHKQGHGELNAQLGLRQTMMLNLPADYALHGHPLWEPRVQLSYTLTRGALGSTLRAGYGVESKLPSADYLYPDRVYTDYIVMNAYFDDPAKRRLITYTRVQDPTNRDIRENRNRKVELGWDLRWHDYVLSLTAFHEQMDGGIEYTTQYTPFTYTYYYELAHPVDARPERSDYLSRQMHEFGALRQPVNSSKVVKRGVEYRLHVPRIAPLRTEVEVNGAWYKTMYTNGVPVMYSPPQMVAGESFPYMGLFDGFDKTYAESLNTNFWLNTHLPRLKLIFTNFVQIVWYERSRLGRDVSYYPERYMDKQGNVYPLTDERMQADPTLQSLHRQLAEARYNERREPVSVQLNLKLTKEFSRRVKFSFFADNILQVSPKYRNGYEQTVRNWHRSFCGAELTLTLF